MEPRLKIKFKKLAAKFLKFYFVRGSMLKENTTTFLKSLKGFWEPRFML